MDPITMFRNALGKEHGGSGELIDKTKYLKSIEFWDKNIMVR